jgi:hypothetical protein
MKDVRINGHNLRFDWGTLEFIGSATGLDPADPLKGIPVFEQATAILYGGLARVDEIKEQPVTYSLPKCKQLIKDFSGAQVKKLIDAYNVSMLIDADEDEISESEDDKTDKQKSRGPKK